MAKDLITIIIPVFNNHQYTKACIDSIYNNTDISSFKIIVVDNASSDKTPEYLREEASKYNNFKFIINSQNLGFAKANNQAVKLSDTKKILFLKIIPEHRD